jgi:type I restriction enzyme S subunit
VNAPLVALGDIVEIKGGGTPSKANPAFWEGDIPWVSPKDMKQWDICDAEDKITVEAIKGSATNLIPENAILIVNRSGILKHTLPVGITRRPVAINQDIKALVCGVHADAGYIAHIVKASEPVVLKWVRATTADNFSIDNLRRLEIPLPPLPEQRRIATILDKADALRRKRKRAIELLDSLTQSIFLEMFGDPLANPMAWPVESLGSITAKIGSGATPLGGDAAYKSSGTSFVRSMNVRDEGFLVKGLAYIDEQQARKLDGVRLEAEDVLLNITGASVARVCLCPESVLPARVNQHVSIIRLRDKCLSSYVAQGLKTPTVKARLLSVAEGGATRQAITKAQIEAIALPIPDAERIQQFNASVDQIAKLRMSIGREDEFDSLFSSLQSRAFSGRL